MDVTMRRTTSRGFTLVEILIVVIILGILAAIVVPQFTNATTDARRASLLRQLHTIRSQIQLFIVEHEGAVPALNGVDWDDLTTRTTFKFKSCGPYLPSAARNSVNGFSAVAVVAADPNFGDAVAGANIGFVYNSTTGSIWATNSTGTKVYNEANLKDPNN